MFTGHALDGNVSAMYELLRTILLETDFDAPKAKRMIRQLLQTSASGAVDAIAGSGHSYARLYAAAGLTRRGRMVEQTEGLTQVQLITSLAAAEENEEAMNELIAKLKMIQALVVTNLKLGARVALTCGSDTATANEEALDSFLKSTATANLTQNLIAADKPVQSGLQYPPGVQTFFNFPYQVSYSALALPTGPYTDPTTAPFAILSQLLTTNTCTTKSRKGRRIRRRSFQRRQQRPLRHVQLPRPEPGEFFAHHARCGSLGGGARVERSRTRGSEVGGFPGC